MYTVSFSDDFLNSVEYSPGVLFGFIDAAYQRAGQWMFILQINAKVDISGYFSSGWLQLLIVIENLFFSGENMMKLFHIQRDGRAVGWNLIGRRVKEKAEIFKHTTETYYGDPDYEGDILLMLIKLQMSMDDFVLLW
jgi:hypothetical protein